jgi:uncharacterized protein (DUF2235 family)
MSKTLIVCCDGTWDTPGESSGDRPTCTNVYKLWRGLADTDARGDAQRTFYHEGVGTGGRLDRAFGGVFGAGVAHTVCDCYRFLALNYDPGDRICLFGFSRGAFTARSVAGMVRNCGLLRPEHLGHLGAAFTLYRRRGRSTRPSSPAAQAFRRDFAVDAPIFLIGVWDTVGSLGVPVAIPFWTPWWVFHDTELSATVRHAYHAMSIDEQRGPFKPTLWTRSSAPPDQTLSQVWFVGAHRDVGGGYDPPDLADITLCWMVDNARACGLAFDPGHFVVAADGGDPRARYEGEVVRPDPFGQAHDSRTGIWKALWSHPRDILYPTAPAEQELSNQSISNTAVIRRDAGRYESPRLDAYLAGTPDVTDVDFAAARSTPG